MATIKSYTDISQSRKLAEILPIESADMRYTPDLAYPWVWDGYLLEDGAIPCWSLCALLDILYPDITLDHTEGEGWSIITIIVKENPNSILRDIITEKVIADNPIDACVEMILKLNEQKLL